MKVLLADDHTLFRSALRRLIDGFRDCEIVAECADGDDALTQFSVQRPDVAVLDVAMPGIDGLEATRRMLANDPDARILIISLDTDGTTARRAAEAGALGFLAKQDVGLELEAALRTVSRGKPYPSDRS